MDENELIAELVNPQAGERISDPACGSGSLLIKCGNQLLKNGTKDFALYGQEITGSTWALTKMNIFCMVWAMHADRISDSRMLKSDPENRTTVYSCNQISRRGASQVYGLPRMS